MRHISSIVSEPWFHAKPWLILGTGPSLDKFDYDKDGDKYNIAAIYAASDVCRHVDLHFMSDEKAWEVVDEKPARYVATRTINLYWRVKNLVFFEYDCDIQHWTNGISLFPGITPYPCSNTSSFVTMFLGMSGVKNVYHYGIDGGFGNSERVDKRYVALNDKHGRINYDIENQGFFGHARHYGMKLTRL